MQRQYHTRAHADAPTRGTRSRARTHIRTCSGATTEIHFGRIGPDIIRHSSCDHPPQTTSSYLSLARSSSLYAHVLLGPRSSSAFPRTTASPPHLPSNHQPSLPACQTILAIRSHCANTRQRTRLYFDRQVVRMRNGSGVSSEITACPIRLLVYPLFLSLTHGYTFSVFVSASLPVSVSLSLRQSCRSGQQHVDIVRWYRKPAPLGCRVRARLEEKY